MGSESVTDNQQTPAAALRVAGGEKRRIRLGFRPEWRAPTPSSATSGPASSCSASSADDVELAVMRAADAIYRPHIDALIEADLERHEPRARRRPLAAARGRDEPARPRRCASRRRRSPPATPTPRELLDDDAGADRGAQPGAQRGRRRSSPSARARCSPARPRGPLHGVPVVIKDEWPLPWRAERFGAAEMLGRAASPGESGPYRALRDAGAVIVGVANMHEYGAGSTGDDLRLRAGAQPLGHRRAAPAARRAGPARAVGGRLVAGAVGADGIGSIRYPAAYCGITGLKPTFGRSAMEGHHIAAHDDDRLGPDLRRRRRLPAARRGAVRRGARSRRRRPGCGSASSAAPFWEDCDPEVREACELALEALRERDRRRASPRSRSTASSTS